MEQEISDLEYAIDELDAVISTLKEYKEFEQDVKDLAIYQSTFEVDLDNLKREYEIVQSEMQKEYEKESMQLERQYWKEAL